MEPTKIESIAELDLKQAEQSAMSILSLVESLRFSAPEDAPAHNARLRDIAVRMDALTEALKLTPPATDLQAKIARHREAERRHRDQRALICDLLQTHWDAVGPRVKELLEDARMKVDLIGELRAGAATAGLDPEMRPIDLAKALAARCSEPSASYRLQSIHAELQAAGLTPAGADPWNPIDSVKRLIEERRELLEEMARGAPPEAVAVAASELGDQAERGEDVPWTDKKTAAPESVADFMRGDGADAAPDILPGALRAAHDALIAVITASERDWSRSADLAWIYGVLVGWSEHDLEVLQVSFGWREQVVRVIDEHRAALVCAGMSEP